MALNNKIYSACYSNVPVYEYNVGPGVHIMRRRAGEFDNDPLNYCGMHTRYSTY